MQEPAQQPRAADLRFALSGPVCCGSQIVWLVRVFSLDVAQAAESGR